MTLIEACSQYGISLTTTGSLNGGNLTFKKLPEQFGHTETEGVL